MALGYAPWTQEDFEIIMNSPRGMHGCSTMDCMLMDEIKEALIMNELTEQSMLVRSPEFQAWAEETMREF